MANQQTNTIQTSDKSDKIEIYIAEIRQLQYIIGNSHYMINSLAHQPELQEMHAQETMPLIDDYNYLVLALKELLKDQFEWEHEMGLPTSLRYWKLYYELDTEDLYY